MNCSKCDISMTANFCSQCGRPLKIARVDGHYIAHEIQHVLHFEKGIPFTAKELLLRPGASVRSFISADRNRLVKPVLFLFVTSLMYTIIDHLFHIEQGYIQYQGTMGSATSWIFNWVQNHYGYSNIVFGIFISFWLKLIYRSHDYNFFEILILLCFVTGVAMLIFSLFALIEGLTGLPMMKAAGVIGLSYCCWAIGNFFDGKRLASYWKAVASYTLGMITFAICILCLGGLVDFLK